jgi:hypothetical protein
VFAIVYYDQRGKIKDYPIRQKFRLDAFLDGKPVPVLTNFKEIVQGTATELKFGPTFEGVSSLVPSEQVFMIPANLEVKGDVELSAADLSIEAVGPINGQTTDGAARSAKSKRNAEKGGKSAAATNAPKPTVTPAVAGKRTVTTPKGR